MLEALVPVLLERTIVRLLVWLRGAKRACRRQAHETLTPAKGILTDSMRRTIQTNHFNLWIGNNYDTVVRSTIRTMPWRIPQLQTHFFGFSREDLCIHSK
jgi:hypothetical protein